MKSDQQFLIALAESQQHVFDVARWMSRQGWDVLIKPNQERPSFESRNDFADSGDLEVRQRIEVKARDLDFTSSNDYPFKTVIVDEQFKIDRIPERELYGYVILNKAKTHACLISGRDRKKWSVREKYDRKDEQSRRFYECPIEFCTFVPFKHPKR